MSGFIQEVGAPDFKVAAEDDWNGYSDCENDCGSDTALIGMTKCPACNKSKCFNCFQGKPDCLDVVDIKAILDRDYYLVPRSK